MNIADKFIPNRIVTVKKDDAPWISNKIKRLIRRKNRVHRKAKLKNTPYQWEKFRKIRNKCNSAVAVAKTSYYESISAKILAEDPKTKNWWNLIKSLLGNRNKKPIPPLKINNEFITDDTEKAELFNAYFCEQSNLNDCHKNLPDFDDTLGIGLDNIIITELEVEDILNALNTSKAIGPDLISPRILKEGKNVLKYPLCKLFNLSLQQGIYPDLWKYANVIPVFKKECPSNIKNYRPISLISIVGKDMERCITCV